MHGGSGQGFAYGLHVLLVRALDMVDEPIFEKLQQFHADLGRAPGQGGAELRYFGREVAMDADVLL